MKIGVFGSALNPITLGHIDAIEQALETNDKVIVIPSFCHAHGKVMKPFDERVEMARQSVAHHFDERVEVVDVEKGIYDGEPIYTWKLMDALDALYPHDELNFLCGSDNFTQFHIFDKSEYILSKWGVSELKERKDIRSTYVRNAVEAGHSIEGMVTPSLINTINRMYK